MVLALFIVIVITAFAFGITTGLTNGGGLVATIITTRAMEPLGALILVAVCEVLGLVFLGMAVAQTLAHHVMIFPPDAPAVRILGVLTAAFLGALVWYGGMWYLSLPTASSHALVGGMVGAILLEYGTQAVNWPIIITLILFLGLIPIVGVLAGLLLSRFVYWVGGFLTPSVKGVFRGLEILSLAGVALVQGSNDGQKCLAMILMASAALTTAMPGHSLVLRPILFLIGFSLAIGVLAGSRRMVGTLGKRLYRVEALQGFSAEVATFLIVGASSQLGYPVSTSQILSSSVLGAGVAVQPRDIRWNLVGDIGLAWLVSIPAAGLLAAAFAWIIRYVVS